MEGVNWPPSTHPGGRTLVLLNRMAFQTKREWLKMGLSVKNPDQAWRKEKQRFDEVRRQTH